MPRTRRSGWSFRNDLRYHTIALRAIVAVFTISAALCAQSALEKAVELAQHRHYAEARQSIAIQSEPAETPQRIAFHRLKAAIASGLGEPSVAVREMHAALALAPGNPKLLLATAVAEMQAGSLDDALRHAQSAGDTPAARAIAGDIEDQRGDYAAAADAYQAAVSLAPGEEPYRIALAMELIQHQSFPAAIQLLDQSAPMFPRSAKLPTLLGIADYASGFSDEAIAEFAKAISIDLHFEPAYRCLAQILLESSQAPKPDSVALLCRWNVFACSAVHLRTARERDDEAAIRKSIATLERAPPGNALAACELARGYEWTHQLLDARQHMETCVSLDPTPQNHYRLGLLYRKLGLSKLAEREMALRGQLQAKMTEQTAAGLSALQDFKLSVR